MSRELREFDLNEAKARFIAFVPKGANKKQYFLVKEDRQLKEDILKAILETDETEVTRTLKEAKLEGETAGVLEATAKILKAYKDLLPEDALRILAKACGLPEPVGEMGEKEPPAGKDSGKEAGKDAGKEAGVGGEGGGAASGDPLNKEDLEKMDPKARSIIEKLLEDQQLTKAEADEAKRIAKDLKDQQVLKEYVAKAEELQNLPVQPLKFGPVMKTLGESHPREFEEIFKLLKAADAILDKSELFREFGKAGSGEGSAEAQIYAKARAMVAKDADLTFEQAVEKVLNLEPELYEKAEEERQERIARRKGGR